MKKNSILFTAVFALLLLVTTVASINLTNIYAQDEESNIDSDNEITSQLGPEVLTNETVPFNDQNATGLTPVEPGAEGLDNFTIPSLGNESLPAEGESFDT
jgi:hypothetical protein